jgi:hypothetical protein
MPCCSTCMLSLIYSALVTAKERASDRNKVSFLVVAIIMVLAIALIIVGYNIDGAGFNGYIITTISKTISGVAPPTNTTTTVY